jgi:cytochrome c-type biogenesis protein CcmH/NrfG
MNQEVDIYTETMAKVYADQGHWARAVEIYQHLAQREPQRQDLIDGLVHARQKMEDQPTTRPEELVPLFREWIELLLQQEKLEKLKKLRRKL